MGYKIVKEKENSTNPEKKDFNINIEVPKWTLNELALSSAIKDQIDEIVAYIKNRDILLDEWEFKKFLKSGNGISINFFGQPGTGKTVTAEAIADKLGVNIIKVNYGELESELVGRTSKNLSELFAIAENSRSLLFFDEADTLLSKRISNLSQAADYGVNSVRATLLTLLEKFNGVIIFATNLFENYDEAFIRRILFNIEFTLPDTTMRIQLWEFHLSPKIPKEISYDKAAEISEGLAGGDIKNITFKLALKLLTKKIESISEDIMKEEIQKYLQTKEQHKKGRSLESSTVTFKSDVKIDSNVLSTDMSN
ncbi:ATP-binding protein [Brasilonema bromeliae]|uniref:AAA family ATPase n=1 Tax=Brasilonema bromeliae SPC951 TaxID=385972 RepID=A0ABX1PH40_9CYAN|nr:ATP-binding protein [Brasilonema bromeliae]NMG22697.1 AAA family ATPase [Brasilonema bromeliae SPC951]